MPWIRSTSFWKWRGRSALEGARERVAEPADELLELLHLQRVGLLVHAIQAGRLLLRDELGHRLVREEHELLDQPVRDVALGGDDVLDEAGSRP